MIWNYHNIPSDEIQCYSTNIDGIALTLTHNTITGMCAGSIGYRGRLRDGIKLGTGLEHATSRLIAHAASLVRLEITGLEFLNDELLSIYPPTPTV